MQQCKDCSVKSCIARGKDREVLCGSFKSETRAIILPGTKSRAIGPTAEEVLRRRKAYERLPAL